MYIFLINFYKSIDNLFHITLYYIMHQESIGGMAELADATDSKSVTGDSVWVQVPLPPLLINTQQNWVFFS